jgi:hypothetical protein
VSGLRRAVVREPALITGVVTAAIGLAVLFGLDLSRDQIAGIAVFLGAVMALLRFVLTPSSEVIAQATPEGPVAGAAAEVVTGQPVAVSVSPISRAAPPV